MSKKTKKPVFTELSPDALKEAKAWLEQNSAILPTSVLQALNFGVEVADKFSVPAAKSKGLLLQLRRALGIIPSSERRRSSGDPTVQARGLGKRRQDEKEWLLQELKHTDKLRLRFRNLANRHDRRSKNIREKLMELDEIEITAEDEARIAKEDAECVERLLLGQRCDLECAKNTEKLMRGLTTNVEIMPLTIDVERDTLPKDAVVQQSFYEDRDRTSFSFSVSQVQLSVEKLSIKTKNGMSLVAADLGDIGPAKMKVTWEFLCSMTILACQYAMPLNRFAAMASSEAKRFTGGEVSRYFRYVAGRFLPIYLQLAKDLANCQVLCGDDTSSRVLEFNKAIKAIIAKKSISTPWEHYADTEKSAKTITSSDNPSFGAQIAAILGFEFARKDGTGAKIKLNTSMLSGRSDQLNPKSTIVFYRSHIGGLGDLLDMILPHRDKDNREIVIQSDLATVNLISKAQLKDDFTINLAGCSSHARRPFALHESDDPVLCEAMIHYFKVLAILETSIDLYGRNRENTLAVRSADAKQTWETILETAEIIKSRWASKTPLGDGARYIINNYKRLTYYLTDFRLWSSNNFSERMIRMEKLIEDGALFRQTLEGRFALDIMRTILQTSIAAGINLEAYMTWVMMMPEHVVKQAPEEFTPLAYTRHLASLT